MKKIIVITFLFFSFSLFSQALGKTIERSLNSIQIGTVGGWFNNEVRFADQFTLRTEIGLYSEITAGVGFFLAPEVNLEPRWYYNFKKRAKKSLNVTNNSANFLTVKTSYRSSLFEISSFDDNLNRAEDSFSIIPKWGIRRSLSMKINYELGLGLGYLFYINQKYPSVSESDGLVVDLHIRIGYNF
ncbi:hypothetical protein [uncultured Polaribacter sp.]|uniref:hypothetical protein n=1 Tax=uncultured Polaribacter sp. TaxID=174711 RepID=UPI00262717BD|nr:hypothetical protein [uncultured Polaribacter sp.]